MSVRDRVLLEKSETLQIVLLFLAVRLSVKMVLKIEKKGKEMVSQNSLLVLNVK